MGDMWAAVSVRDILTLAGAAEATSALLCDASTLLALPLLELRADGCTPAGAAVELRCVQCMVGKAAPLGGGTGCLATTGLLPPATLNIPASVLLLVLPMGGRLQCGRAATFGSVWM